MDRFSAIDTFVRVAESQSFAEAARQMRLSRSVVTARIQQPPAVTESYNGPGRAARTDRRAPGGLADASRPSRSRDGLRVKA